MKGPPLLDFQFLRHIIQIDGQNFADALLLHIVVAKSAKLRFRLAAKTAPAPLLLLFPPLPLRRVTAGALLRRHHALFDLQFLGHIVQIDGQYLADALLLHGDAVEDVGLLHGAPAVGDDDELGLPRQAPHIPGHPDNIWLVQSGFDLVHDAEGRGMDFQNGEVQGNGHECLFAAGQQRDGFEGLPGRLGLDLDAAAQDVVLVLQLQAGGAAAEEVGKGGLEALVDEFELLRENHCHLAGDLLDNARQLLLGLFHVVALVGQVGVAAVDTVELLNGADIDSTQRIDLPLQLADAAAGLGDALQFNALGLRVGVAELVVLPQAVQNLLFLHGRGGHFLFQL